MYLSRLFLNPHSRQVHAELAYPYELHRTLMRACSDHVKEERLLYRVETEPETQAPVLLVQSQLLPAWERLADGYLAKRPANPAVKQLNLNLKPGQTLSFRLRANPTKRLSKSLSRNMDKSKRVGLYRTEEQLDWLDRKGAAHGFRVLHASASRQERTVDHRHNLQFLSVQFDGILQVVDPDALAAAVDSGIGSGKAFGFGLLSLAPVR
jgi:CRISPR system Cascade subunit CasE